MANPETPEARSLSLYTAWADSLEGTVLLSKPLSHYEAFYAGMQAARADEAFKRGYDMGYSDGSSDEPYLPLPAAPPSDAAKRDAARAERDVEGARREVIDAAKAEHTTRYGPDGEFVRATSDAEQRTEDAVVRLLAAEAKAAR